MNASFEQVHPSGELKAGKDYWVAQAAAGDTFSMTREANWEDAARASEGFLWMKAVRKAFKLGTQHKCKSFSLLNCWLSLAGWRFIGLFFSIETAILSILCCVVRNVIGTATRNSGHDLGAKRCRRSVISTLLLFTASSIPGSR